MRETKRRIRVILSYVFTVLLATAYPVATFAETGTDPATTTTSSETQTSPPPTYTYDAATGRWNTDSWQYNAMTGTYQAVPPPVVVPPPTETAPTNATPASEAPSATDPSAPTSTEATLTSPSGSGTNTGKTDLTQNTTATTSTNNLIGNTLDSSALTGDASVVHNTAAGNATTGNATVSQTVMNTLNSSIASGAGGVANFVSNISGDVHGDILLYPMILGAMLVQGVLTPPSTTVASNSTLNNQTNNTINNDINLNAATGTATVAGNTSAGSATSGSANAVANVVNMINSAVAAKQSFVGTINIYGNLDGDILIAPDFLSKLIESNKSTTLTQTANISNQTTDAIANNVNLNASTGTATVAGNTSAGNATSGTASTNVVILNLTGHEVVASNSMLVFVNVLGKWVGVIVDAPAGSTAAALGNGINQDLNINTNSLISNQTNNQITNNINASAKTGDATVTRNTSAGNATTGNATASANIANMSQTSLNLTGWFGVLFINVFGSWLGSFGVDTERGNPVPVAGGEAGGGASQQPQAIQFIPKQASSVSTWRPNLLTASATTDVNDPPSILGAQSNAGHNSDKAPSMTKETSTQPAVNFTAAVLGTLVLLGAAAGGIWWAAYRRTLRTV